MPFYYLGNTLPASKLAENHAILLFLVLYYALAGRNGMIFDPFGVLLLFIRGFYGQY